MVEKKVRTKAELDKMSADGRIAQARYEQMKERVLEFEKNNYDRLVVLRSKNGWWKMCGHSALLYYYHIAPRMNNVHPKLQIDTDFKHKSLEGIVSIKSLETLQKRLRELKIYPKEMHEEYATFPLGYKVSDDELKRFMHSEEERRKMINQIVIPKQLFPDIYKRLIVVEKEMRNIVRQMQPQDREIYGLDEMRELRDILTLYMRMANGQVDVIKGLRKLAEDMQIALYHLQVILELELLETKRGLRLSRGMVEVRRIALAEMRKLEEAKEA
ncbi:hypothetical protein IJH97_02095 [Candidatus Saccharibacteria bacterium]|nr:hypothetical protein [Candidatus Saccharibacteria bacterium]